MSEEVEVLPPVKIAFVIDGEVVEVLHTDYRLGAILLSEPIMIDVSETQDLGSLMGATYDQETGKFIIQPAKE